MRTTIIIAILLSFFPAWSRAQWQWQNPIPQGNSLANVCFTTQNTGFFVGAGGTILKTTDAGYSWQILSSGTEQSLADIYFTSENVGYAVGGTKNLSGVETIVLKTTANGLNWNTVFTDSVGPLSAVSFANNMNGLACGDSGIVLKTADGGVSWTYLNTGSSEPFNDVVLLDTLTGLIAGDNSTLLKTIDGGASWTDVTVFPSNSKILSLSFPNEDTGYALCTNYGTGSLAKTIDGGSTWNIIKDIPWTVYSLAFPCPDTGYISGAFVLLRTTNGGVSWETLNSNAWFNRLYFTDAFTGYAVYGSAYGVAQSPLIYKTTDMGESWFPLVDYVTTAPLLHVEFPNKEKGFIVGGGGQIGQLLRTIDGQTWDMNLNTGDTVLIGSQFLDENVGYVFGYYFDYISGYFGVIYSTTNGGESWVKNTIPWDFKPRSISFINDSTGYMSGSSEPETLNEYADLLMTSSWGANWTSAFSDTSGYYPSIKFTSHDTGYLLKRTIGSSNPKIVVFKTTNGGTSWNQVFSLNGNPPSDLYFYSNDFGFLIPIGGPVIYRTSDGGMNWDAISVNLWVNSIFFVNPSEGFLVGGNGQISKTEDGGQSWISIDSPTANWLFDLFFLSVDSGYIVGDMGTILFTADGGYPVIQHEFYNEGTVHLSNYPNPFPLTTTITCNLSSTCDISIEIYRLTGEVIKSTSIMRQPAGRFETSFDASDLPSGIYLYRLKANDIVETKKMIVIH